MNELQEALLTGVMLSWLTWGTLKVVWRYAIKGD